MSRKKSFDVAPLLLHECRRYGVNVNASTIAHQHAGMGAFPQQGFTKRIVVWYDEGMLVYPSRVDVLQTRNIHGENVMAVTCQEFHTSSIKLGKQLASWMEYGALFG